MKTIQSLVKELEAKLVSAEKEIVILKDNNKDKDKDKDVILSTSFESDVDILNITKTDAEIIELKGRLVQLETELVEERKRSREREEALVVERNK